MNRTPASIRMRFCISLLLVLSTLLSSGLASPPGAAMAASEAFGFFDWFPIGPPNLPLIPSNPLVRVRMPSRTGAKSGPEVPPAGAGQGSASLDAQSGSGSGADACGSLTVDLKVLVLTADPTDTATTLPAIRQALDYPGTPYTVFTASPRPTDPTTNRLASLLSSGCQGYYQGIILGNGQLAYSDPIAGWQSALTDVEWQTLWSYERTFGIRQVTWYTYPTAEYGFMAPTAGFDTTTNPISGQYTAGGQTTFTYANTANPLTIQYVWAYQAKPLDSNTTALLQDGSGNALVATRTYTDGTQNLALTFDSNVNVLHDLVLAYGVVNWVTGGLFLGERHVFVGAQADDIFIDAHVWSEGTPCGSDPEKTNELYRMTGDDLQAVMNWQAGRQAQATTQAFKFDLVFNGEGTTGIYNPDTLTPKATANQALFKWINHTFTHENLDNATYNQALSEFTSNNQTAQQLGFTTYSTLNLVTPDVSGLTNTNAMRAAYDTGVRYVVSDASRVGYGNPSPNLGIYNQYQPSILMIPRRPNNLFYNVTNQAQWTQEYNCLYRSFWGRDLTYDEILTNESNVLLRYMLIGEMDPWMFHETNLRAYDGTHTLLGDLLDRILDKYNGVFVLPIVSPTMDGLGAQMASRMAYSTAGVTASIIPGQSITLSSQQAAVVPVTGLDTAGAESYGGQLISHVALNAGETVTLPLNNPPGSTPTPSNTATPANTPTQTPAASSTPLPPTATRTNTPLPPTATKTNTPLPPTATKTNTPLPPTATRTNTPLPPTATKTNTPLPPTATKTNTPLSPTASNTPLPPTATKTNTPLPPTATPTPANRPPVAYNNAYTMGPLDLVLIVPAPGVLGNDSDPDGNPLTAALVTSTRKGILLFGADGSFTYTPNVSVFSFTDTFTYKAFDGTAYSNVATVTIQVNRLAPQQAPRMRMN